MKLGFVALMLGISLSAAACSGCQPIAKVTGEQPIAAGTVIDEKAMGAVYALGTSTNLVIEASAKSGKLTREQLLLCQEIRRDTDASVAAAKAAYDVGDAAGFSARMAAVTALAKKASALYEEFAK